MIHATAGNRISIAILFFLSAMIPVGWATVAHAGFIQNIQLCASNRHHPDIRITACTSNIQSGRLLGNDLAVVYTYRGLAYLAKRALDKAFADYTEAIGLTEDNADIFNNRGNVLYYKGENELAMKDYNEAVRLNPNHVEAYHNRGNIFRNEGQFDLAMNDYNKVLQLRPGSAYTYADRGLTFEKKGEQVQALLDYKKAYDLGFRHPLLLKKLRESGEIL